MHHHGHGVPQDQAEALRWYRLAADAGNVPSLGWIGWFYHHGHGVAKNLRAAIGWYERAIKAGNTPWAEHLANARAELAKQ